MSDAATRSPPSPPHSAEPQIPRLLRTSLVGLWAPRNLACLPFGKDLSGFLLIFTPGSFHGFKKSDTFLRSRHSLRASQCQLCAELCLQGLGVALRAKNIDILRLQFFITCPLGKQHRQPKQHGFTLEILYINTYLYLYMSIKGDSGAHLFLDGPKIRERKDALLSPAPSNLYIQVGQVSYQRVGFRLPVFLSLLLCSCALAKPWIFFFYKNTSIKFCYYFPKWEILITNQRVSFLLC